MRYLKIYAKDICDDNLPDVVLLEFHDTRLSPCSLVKTATTFDINYDARMDWVLAGDVNGDGLKDETDNKLAIKLAQRFLEFNWFSLDAPFNKYLKVFVQDFDCDGIPDTFRLHFHQGDGEPRDETIVKTVSFYTENAKIEEAPRIKFDANGDKIIDEADRTLVLGFIDDYLESGWF